MTPQEISSKLDLLKEALLEQARDQIDMGDYRQQIRAYQIMLRDLIVLVKELADSVDTALIPPLNHLPLD